MAPVLLGFIKTFSFKTRGKRSFSEFKKTNVFLRKRD